MAGKLLTVAGMVVLLSPSLTSTSGLPVAEDAQSTVNVRVPATSSLKPQSRPRGRSDRQAERPRGGSVPDHHSTEAKGILRTDVASAHHKSRAEPKENPDSQPFTPSLPVSFSSFSFIPSRPPPGADTYFREDTTGVTRSPGRQVPRVPPIPRPVQSHSRAPFVHYANHYEPEEEVEYTPAYEERQHFPDYDSDYESVHYEEFEDNPQYDDHQSAPYYEGVEYHASPSLKGHHHPSYEEAPRHHTPPGLHLHHNQHHQPTRDTRQPPHSKTPNEEDRGDTSQCKIVEKNGMTCEVCRDDEGGFSEHCSHSTRSDQDETYATNRRHRKRNAVAAASPQVTSGQARQSLVQRPRSRVYRTAVQKARSGPNLVTAVTTTADTHHHARHPSSSSSSSTTTTTTTAEADSRQDTGFDFDFDDHDITFYDDHNFDFGHGPNWYHMAAPRTPLSLRSSSFKDTHAQLTEAMEQFMNKDRSSCKKVEKHGMTCYVCPRGAAATDEECMYASHHPDGHDLHYSEETTYGSSSHYPGISSSKGRLGVS